MNSGGAELLGTHARLDSWKAIARYLGRSPRTAQRWHATYHLPIRRLGGDSGPIFAYVDELDDWLRNRGGTAATEREDFEKAEPLDRPFQQGQPAHRDEALELYTTPRSRKDRSAELVTLAHRMWENLSYPNLFSITRLFREAIDLDPDNARAFAGLSLALIAGGLLGNLRTAGGYASAQAATRRATEIDPELIETKGSAAWLKMVLERDWQGAFRGFNEVLGQCPQCTHALEGIALLHIAEGSAADALRLLSEASRRNPLSAPTMALFCWSEYLAGEFAKVLGEISQARATGHSGPLLDAVEALALIHLEEPASHIERIEAMVEDSPHHYVLQGVLGYTHAVTGRSGHARQILHTLTQPKLKDRGDLAYPIALILLGLNDRKKAAQWLEQSYLEGSLWSLGYQSDPILASFRDDLHIQLLMSKIRYPSGATATLRLASAS